MFGDKWEMISWRISFGREFNVVILLGEEDIGEE